MYTCPNLFFLLLLLNYVCRQYHLGSENSPHIKGRKTKTVQNREQHATGSNTTALAFRNCSSNQPHTNQKTSRESFQKPNSVFSLLLYIAFSITKPYNFEIYPYGSAQSAGQYFLYCPTVGAIRRINSSNIGILEGPCWSCN